MITTIITNSNALVGNRIPQKTKNNPSNGRIREEKFSTLIPKGYITIDEFDQNATKMINDLFSSNEQSFIQRKSKQGPN